MKQSRRRQGKWVGVKWRTSKNYLATQTDYVEGAANLDLLIDEIDRMEKLVDQASTLHDRFSTDVKSRDTNYALGIKFITKYFEIVEKTEPTVSATPKLTTLLHTTDTCIPPQHDGTRKISVQPTGIQRRRVSQGDHKKFPWVDHCKGK